MLFRCYTQLGDLERALLDAETVLKKDRKCQEALYQKAETLYQLGRYEHALVYYHRGHKVTIREKKILCLIFFSKTIREIKILT